MNAPDTDGAGIAPSNLRAKIRNVEADLHDQGVSLFPASRDGHRAWLLWHHIKPHLLAALPSRSR